VRAIRTCASNAHCVICPTSMPRWRSAWRTRCLPLRRNSSKRRAALAEQRELLSRLAELDRKQLDILREVDVAARDFDAASRAARAKLTRFLFWIPAPPSTRTVGQFAPALGWFATCTFARRPGSRALWAAVMGDTNRHRRCLQEMEIP